MTEVTLREQTDLKHTEHDFHQLAQEAQWTESCMQPAVGRLSVAEEFISCGEHALNLILLSSVHTPSQTIFDTKIDT